MEKKKIPLLFITHAYYNKGGVEEHVRDLSEGLKDEFDCFILTPVQDQTFHHYQLIKNGFVKEIFPANFFNSSISPLKDNLATSALLQTIKRIQPKLIHIHHLQNWPLTILADLTNSKIPIAFTAHDYFLATPIFTMEFSEHPKELLSKEYSEKVFGRDLSEYLNLRRNIYLESINKIKCCIVPSASTKSEISKVIPLDYQVIPHGIKDFEIRKKINVQDKVSFGFIGSLIRQKGIKTLVEAFKIAKAKNSNIELKVFGSGNEEFEVKNDTNINYSGKYSRKDLSNILSSFQVGIIPSIFKETFCYSLAEMQFAGIPVIASRIGALSEKVTAKSGLLSEPGNARELAENMLHMAKIYQTNSWEIDKPRNLKTMCNDYSNLYQNLI